MAGERVYMRAIRGSLRGKLREGRSHRAVSRSLGVSRSPVPVRVPHPDNSRHLVSLALCEPR